MVYSKLQFCLKVLVIIRNVHFFCRDTLIVSLINCGTSLFAGFVIFTMMGFMSHKLGVDVEDVVKGGMFCVTATETGTTTPQIKNLISLVKKNRRAARAART